MEETELIQYPCSQCGLPVDITPEKKALLESGRAEDILCLECFIERNPSLFE